MARQTRADYRQSVPPGIVLCMSLQTHLPVGTTRVTGRQTLRLPGRPLSALGRPALLFENITPNWFASVMGTGIVANAAATLPVQVAGLRTLALCAWFVASVALVCLSVAFALHWHRHPARAAAYAAHPVMSQFYGAAPMALLTVGAGTLLVGRDVIGLEAAVKVDTLLWIIGTAAGLATSLWVPFRMITRHDQARADALPAWLMPVVPPMVSATTGALLLPHVAAGQARLSLFLACYALFGLSLFIGLIIVTLIYSRLIHRGMPPVQAAPTVWIMLGLIGQSVTAANLLGNAAHTAIAAPFAQGLKVFGLIFGITMGGFGVLMFCLAVALTVHSARRGLHFSLTWWSFTFPIGTCVTGATAHAATSGSVAIADLAVGLFVVLLGAWATVAAKTLHGSLTGAIFLPA